MFISCVYLTQQIKTNTMTLSSITKQVEKLEVKISELSRKLNKTQCTKVEIELSNTRELLYHFAKIQSLLIHN